MKYLGRGVYRMTELGKLLEQHDAASYGDAPDLTKEAVWDVLEQ